MKKPINKFALALWVLAIIVLVTDVVTAFMTHQELSRFAGAAGGVQPTWFLFSGPGALIRGGISQAAEMAGLGVIIELVDQIRWNALQRTK